MSELQGQILAAASPTEKKHSSGATGMHMHAHVHTCMCMYAHSCTCTHMCCCHFNITAEPNSLACDHIEFPTFPLASFGAQPPSPDLSPTQSMIKKFKNSRNLSSTEKEVYREMRRQSHISAEQKRRGSIKVCAHGGAQSFNDATVTPFLSFYSMDLISCKCSLSIHRLTQVGKSARQSSWTKV